MINCAGMGAETDALLWTIASMELECPLEKLAFLVTPLILVTPLMTIHMM